MSKDNMPSVTCDHFRQPCQQQAQVAQLPQGPAERDRYGGSPLHACGKEKHNGMVLESGRQVHLALIIWNLAAEDK